MRRRRGTALVIALAVVVVVTTLGVVATDALVRATRDARVGAERAAARLAAEGGVEAARAALARDPSWTGGEFEVGEAAVRVVVQPADDAGARCVRAVGLVARPPHGVQVVVAAVVRLGRDGTLPAITDWRE